MKVKFFVAFLVILLPLTLASETQDRFLVYVKVGGDEHNKHAVNTVDSHLKRELRLLGDVDIVGESDNWEYIIEVVMLTLKLKDGRETGNFAIATRHAIRLNDFYYKYPKQYKTMPATFGGILGAAYYSRESLPHFCVNHVNSFDKNILEHDRVLRKALRKAFDD